MQIYNEECFTHTHTHAYMSYTPWIQNLFKVTRCCGTEHKNTKYKALQKHYTYFIQSIQMLTPFLNNRNYQQNERTVYFCII